MKTFNDLQIDNQFHFTDILTLQACLKQFSHPKGINNIGAHFTKCPRSSCKYSILSKTSRQNLIRSKSM